MYIYDHEAKDLFKSLREGVFGALKEKSDFLLGLLEEDDWSLVVKLHALIETVTTQRIMEEIEDERLRKMIHRLALSGEEASKLRITKDLNLFPPEKRSFVRKLSTIRNDIVHNVENLSFTFNDYVNGLDANSKRAWQDAICWFQMGRDTTSQWREASISNPKFAVWMSGFMFVVLTIIDSKEVATKRKLREASEATSSRLLRELLEPLRDS